MKTIEEAKNLIESLQGLQENPPRAHSFPCPRCGHDRMDEKPVRNALSRYASVYICDQCGTDEALRDMRGDVLPLNEWAMVAGFDSEDPTTFLELLRSGEDLDCDLIVGDVDMPATFVWYEDSTITEYGVEKYRPIMDVAFTRLDNGNIEVLCDDWELGEDFCNAAAGYIADSEYKKIFLEVDSE